MINGAFFDNIRSPSTTDPDRPILTGGDTGETPVIVQSKSVIGNANPTVTLAAAPTPGNMLVAVGTHWNNAVSGINGWTLHTNIAGTTNAGIMVGYKIALPGESATQTPFSTGAAAQTMTVFEVSGAVSISLMAYLKEVTANPMTLADYASQDDLLVGHVMQAFSSDPFTLSGDVSTPREDITGNPGQNGPYRVQSFAYTPATVPCSVTVTTTAATSNKAIIGVRVSSQPANRGRVVIGRFASAVAIGTRFPVGKFYFETRLEALAGTPGVGFVAVSYGFPWAALGAGTLDVVYQPGGLVRFKNTTLATLAPYAVGDRVCVAVDPALRLAWFRVNGGGWNNDGLANPATGVGGINISGLTNWQLAPAVSFSTIGSVFKGYFRDADYAFAVPAGFNDISEVNVPTGRTRRSNQMGYVVAPQNLQNIYMVRDFPNERIARLVSIPAGPVKVIAGEVRENDVGVEGRLVRLYNKRTGDFIGEARTNSNGDFVLPARDPDLPHFVVAFDDPEYNAKVYDNVMPA